VVLAAGLGARPAAQAAPPGPAEGVPAFGCAIISPLAATGSYDQQYYHYSLLRTIEDGFRLGGYLGNASAVTPITTVWRAPAG
jgi:hypothetical protein